METICTRTRCAKLVRVGARPARLQSLPELMMLPLWNDVLRGWGVPGRLVALVAS